MTSVLEAHPGGATSIGAVTATLLKAFFDESRVITDPVQPDPLDPTRLVPYSGPQLTVGGELNKLYVLRRYQRLGLGRRLVCLVARRFLGQGISSMLL